MKKLFQKTLNKILNDEGVDMTPKPLSLWISHNPCDDLELTVPITSNIKKKMFGTKTSASVTSASTMTNKSLEQADNANPFLHSLYVPEDTSTNELEIILTESDTTCLFNMPDVNLTTASESIQKIIEKNKTYENLQSKGREKFTEKGSMTLHNSTKNKDIQTDMLIFKDAESQISSYFFYDEEFKEEVEEELFVNTSISKRIKNTFEQASSSNTTTPSEQEVLRKLNTSDVTEEKFNASSNFHYLCTIAERLLQYNQFYLPMAIYKKVPLLCDESFKDTGLEDWKGTTTLGILPSSSIHSSKSPVDLSTKRVPFIDLHSIVSPMLRLYPLWKYKCIFYKEFNVTSMSFNHKNPDLLAAAYSQLEYGLQKDGYVCCWCIKNFEYPERIIKVDWGVTALSFSCTKPYLLAIGLFDGTLLFYNVSTNPPNLLFTSSTIAGSHRKPVFALEWMEKNGYEMVLSTSTDGKVLQWMFNNELQCSEILELKLVSKHDKNTKSLSINNSGGLCLDCSLERSEIYLIGTDNGLIHKCSAIHSNQFFKTYTGHIAPVYKVKWCPYESHIFASCGADMSVKVWNRDKTEPLLDLLPLNPPNSPALDLTWCEDRKGALICVFGSELQIWDLFSSKLDPAFIYHVDDIYTSSLSALLYSQVSESIYVGDCIGDISIFRIIWAQEVPVNANLYDSLMS